MVSVTFIKHSKQLRDIHDLLAADKVEHKCATLDSALQVVRDLVTVAESDMDSGKLFAYSVSVARSKG